MSRRRDKQANAALPQQSSEPGGATATLSCRRAQEVLRDVARLAGFFDGEQVVVRGTGRPKDNLVGAIRRLREACAAATRSASPEYRAVAGAARQVKEAWTHNVHLWGPKSAIVRQQLKVLFAELDAHPEFNA